ncbi:MAG: beta-galactosidase [Actinomycetota bacterium]|nr:beta-galactosidase [Actinomycetota bacterium]
MRYVKAVLPLLLTTAFLLLPAAAQAVPRGFFGMVPQTPLGPKDLSRMASGGVETVRVTVPWSSIQPSPRSDYEWGGMDAFVAAAAERGIEVLPVVGTSPKWATGNWRRMPVDNGRQRRAWGEFVRALVERYGHRGEFWEEHAPGTDWPLPRLPIRAWQIWNEENFFYFVKPVSPERFARLLAVTGRAVRQADPRAEIVLGGLFGRPKQGLPRAMDAVDFLRRLYRVRGVKADFDAVALHPYAADVAELRSQVEEVRATMARHGDRRSGLFITEMGWGSANNPRVVAFEVGLHGQARELRAAYGYLLANRGRLRLRQVHWFTWKDVAGSCNFCDSSGLFRAGARFKPKPAWRAFVAVTRRAG